VVEYHQKYKGIIIDLKGLKGKTEINTLLWVGYCFDETQK
jgi:hypothetical protein